MRMKMRLLGGILGLSMLFACASTEEPQKAEETGRRSPDPVAAATVPPGTFDQQKALPLLSQSYEALRSGQYFFARRTAEESLELWPGDARAWDMLRQSCETVGDDACAKRALFFRDKVIFVSSLPPHAAMMGFQNIRLGGTDGRIDPETLRVAERLEAFYDLQDPDVKNRGQPDAAPFLERNPSAPLVGILGVGGAAAGFWALSK